MIYVLGWPTNSMVFCVFYVFMIFVSLFLYVVFCLLFHVSYFLVCFVLKGFLFVFLLHFLFAFVFRVSCVYFLFCIFYFSGAESLWKETRGTAASTTPQSSCGLPTPVYYCFYYCFLSFSFFVCCIFFFLSFLILLFPNVFQFFVFAFVFLLFCCIFCFQERSLCGRGRVVLLP